MKTILLLLWSCCSAAALLGQGTVTPAPLQSVLEQFRVEARADGTEALLPAEAVSPGQVLEYVVTYANQGDRPLSGLNFTLPVPETTVWLPGKTVPEASAVVLADGQRFSLAQFQALENPPLAAVRAIVWNRAELPPGTTAAYRLRVVVASATPPATP